MRIVSSSRPNAYRVLTADGAIAEQFRWNDPEDRRAPREVLEAEGVRFIGERADPAGRVVAPVLARRLTSGAA